MDSKGTTRVIYKAKHRTIQQKIINRKQCISVVPEISSIKNKMKNCHNSYKLQV